MVLLATTGCTWVSLSDEGENVRVVAVSDVGSCQKLGETSVSLLDKVAGIKRGKEKVARELLILGRNSGAEMGGDTVVPAMEIVNGEQRFDVYRCLP